MAELGVEDTRKTSNKESVDVQIANKSHDCHVLRLLRYNFETLGTAWGNYHCCILYRGAQDVAASDCEKAAKVVGQQQLADAL